jgi:hypothetical protein
MDTTVKSIPQKDKCGLTDEKKEILRKQQGTASFPIDMNQIREWSKYED